MACNADERRPAASKAVRGHGWLLLGGEKVSKSKASKGADVVDPVVLIDRYGIDALKYFLLS